MAWKWLGWWAGCLALQGCVAFGYGASDVSRDADIDADTGDARAMDAGRGDTGTRLDAAANPLVDATADALADAAGEGAVDTPDSASPPRCSPGAIRCEGMQAHTCGANGQEETLQDCSADAPVCQRGACVPEVGCTLEPITEGTVCGAFKTCQAGACEAVANCSGDCAGVCTQPKCDLSCEGSDDCTLDCAGGRECNVDCDSSETCATVCAAPLTQCSTSCVDADTCDTRCTDGARCFTDCRGVDDCAVSCESGARCMIDCRQGECAVSCTDSSCLIRCDAGDSFCDPDVTGCASCGDSILACNASCPAPGAAWPPAPADWP